MKTPNSPKANRKTSPGFALIITLIMVALAAIITVVLLTNSSLDRMTASSYAKRMRAELAAQSGLAAALNALVGTNGPADFRYVTNVGDTGQPTLIPLSYDSTSGAVTLDSANKRNLYSTGSTNANLVLSPTASPQPTRTPGYVSVTTNVNGTQQETERYAFYVDEGGSRQNLAVQAGQDRIYARDPNEIPLVTATAAPAPLSATQVSAITTARPAIFTPMTANPVLNNASAPTAPLVDDYSYATASAIANLNPEGKPRVNLLKLKDYVDGLAVDQTPNNSRAQLVDRLLTPADKGAEWGGGNLSFLTKTGRYSTQQCHQIIANLLDYLDSDLIPTTDNVDNPTYFGVEGKADSTGKVAGHPYINFVGTGLVFNRSGAAGSVGGLNSTRVLVVLGLVNPWSLETKDWPTFYIKPEIEITINGTATGGLLGSAASNYFHNGGGSAVFNTTDSGNQMLSYPPTSTSGKIPPNSGFAFPTPMSSSTNYATFFDILGTAGRQPPGMKFDSLGFTITKLRLKYTGTDGKTGYVQVLDGLKNTMVPAVPGSVDMDGSSGALVYKFASGAPDKADFHLNADSRLNFVFTNWTLSKSSENANPLPPSPQSAVNIFTGKDANNWDFTAQAPSVTNHTWYQKTDITSNFYIKSPPTKDPSTGTYPEPKLNSSGELGYLHTGIPWETLRLYVTGSEASGKERDKELLAYVHSGTFASADYGNVPTHDGQTAPASPVPLLGGPLNVNTNKPPTLQALFMGASALTDSNATNLAKNGGDPNAVSIASALAANANSSPFALPSDYLTLPGVKGLTNTGNDFDREVIARRVANMVGTQSTRFTVYTLGEARDKIGGNLVTTSSVNLRAEVEMQTDSLGKPMPRVLSTTYYVSK